MMFIRRRVAPAVAMFLLSTAASFALDGLGIKAQGTNIIVFWPSAGYENYIIQFRSTLDSDSSWMTLAFSSPPSIPDNYPANGNPLTTYTNFGAAQIASGGVGPLSGPMMGASASTVLMAKPADGSGAAVPLALYPPGFDTNTLIIFEAPAPQLGKTALSGTGPTNGPLNGGGPIPSTGFYRVFLKPDFWFDYSHYTFTDGYEFLPVYLGAEVQVVKDIQLLVDGKPFPYIMFDLQQVDFGTPGNPDLEWSYGIWFWNDHLPNGSHQLQLVTTEQLNEVISPYTPFITMTNPPFTTRINNPILFTNQNNVLVGATPTLTAQTTIYPSTWRFDLYDQNNNWVNGGTGTTTDGNISWTWNFYDSQNNLRDNLQSDPYFIPVVTVTPGSAGPQPSAGIQRGSTPVATDYPYTGGWILAYQDKDQFWPEAQSFSFQMWLGISGNLGLKNLPQVPSLLKFGNTNTSIYFNMTTDPVQNMRDRNASWNTFRTYLLQGINRNLYYYGHGNDKFLGGDYDYFSEQIGTTGLAPEYAVPDPNSYPDGSGGTITSTTGITAQWLRQTSPGHPAPPQQYRFVFLDGCETAVGDWPDAFNIGKTTNSLDYYRGPGKWPCAFVGWKFATRYSFPMNSMAVDENGNYFGDYVHMSNWRAQFFYEWEWDGNHAAYLLQALSYVENFLEKGWIGQGTFNKILGCYGYQDLGFNQYNGRGSWPQ
jgi:hypothetical protein